MADAETDNPSIHIGELASRVRALEASQQQSSDSKADSENAREWIKIAFAIPSVVVVLFGLYTQVSAFLENQNKALELTLSQELVEINKQLNATKLPGMNNPGMVQNAIFLLATKGPEAAPLLIYHIESVGDKPSVVDAIGFSLKQIIENSRKGEDQESENKITEVLNIRVKDIINTQLARSAPGEKSIENHINVLTQVYSLIPCNGKSVQDNKKTINSFLKESLEKVKEEKATLSYLGNIVTQFKKGIEATQC